MAIAGWLLLALSQVYAHTESNSVSVLDLDLPSSTLEESTIPSSTLGESTSRRLLLTSGSFALRGSYYTHTMVNRAGSDEELGESFFSRRRKRSSSENRRMRSSSKPVAKTGVAKQIGKNATAAVKQMRKTVQPVAKKKLETRSSSKPAAKRGVAKPIGKGATAAVKQMRKTAQPVAKKKRKTPFRNFIQGIRKFFGKLTQPRKKKAAAPVLRQMAGNRVRQSLRQLANSSTASAPPSEFLQPEDLDKLLLFEDFVQGNEFPFETVKPGYQIPDENSPNDFCSFPKEDRQESEELGESVSQQERFIFRKRRKTQASGVPSGTASGSADSQCFVKKVKWPAYKYVPWNETALIGNETLSPSTHKVEFHESGCMCQAVKSAVCKFTGKGMKCSVNIVWVNQCFDPPDRDCARGYIEDKTSLLEEDEWIPPLAQLDREACVETCTDDDCKGKCHYQFRQATVDYACHLKALDDYREECAQELQIQEKDLEEECPDPLMNDFGWCDSGLSGLE
jgi:hypothetical protein